MRLFLFCCITLFYQTLSFAQIGDSISYAEIEVLIQETDSDLYYPTLMERYLDSDSTMTKLERFCLYYGYIFQPGYNPIAENEHMTDLMDLMIYDENSMPNYEECIEKVDAALVENPLDLSALKYKMYFCIKIDDMELFRLTEVKYKLLLLAIYNSGTGQSMEQPYYVIDDSHEIVVTNSKYQVYLGEKTTVENHEYLKTKKNNIEHMIYFNVEPYLSYLGSM